MVLLLRSVALLVLTTVAAQGVAAQEPRHARRVVRGLLPLLAGNPADVQRATRPTLIRAGGGADVDAARRFFGERDGAGDLVVLRASGSGGYNQYLLDLAGADSVETLIVASRWRAEDACVLGRVSQTEGVFVAGGDQADYVDFWGGTPLASAIDASPARGAPLGGHPRRSGHSRRVGLRRPGRHRDLRPGARRPLPRARHAGAQCAAPAGPRGCDLRFPLRRARPHGPPGDLPRPHCRRHRRLAGARPGHRRGHRAPGRQTRYRHGGGAGRSLLLPYTPPGGRNAVSRASP